MFTSTHICYYVVLEVLGDILVRSHFMLEYVGAQPQFHKSVLGAPAVDSAGSKAFVKRGLSAVQEVEGGAVPPFSQGVPSQPSSDPAEVVHSSVLETQKAASVKKQAKLLFEEKHSHYSK